MAVEVQPQTEGTPDKQCPAKRYAVVVGVNDYTEAGIGNLSFCASDAEAFYDSLITYCEYDPTNVTLFSDGPHKQAKKPLRSNILAAIADMATQAGEEDSVLFFFAGHGTRDTKDSYLLTQEFRIQVIPDTSIPMGIINDYLRQSKAKFIMRFFDACHAGRIGSRSVPVGPDIKKHFLVEGEGWATLSACKEEQYAHEDGELGHGIFSYCLIKGLSGDAANARQEVTFHSLSTYTIAKTTEITNELGLTQTPVLESGVAGDQVLATVRDIYQAEVPEALVKVQETSIEQLKPTAEKVPQFIADIRSTLHNEPMPLDFIASSQERKLALGAALVKQVLRFCHEQEQLYHQQLADVATITVNLRSLKNCPLNYHLAEFIQASKIKQSMELRVTYKLEKVQRSQLLQLQSALYGGSEYRQVMDGITEKENYYESAVVLTIKGKEPLMPVCFMVVAIIPATFGLYLLCYSCSTQLDQGQKESWDLGSFKARTLQAISFTDNDGTQ